MPSAPSPIEPVTKAYARSGREKNLRQMISIVSVCPFFPAMSMEAKMMRRWWWGRAEQTSISSELVKIVYLIAMASLVNNFLSYLDFGMRAKWSREREKSIPSNHHHRQRQQQQQSMTKTAFVFPHKRKRRTTTRLFHVCVLSILLPKRDDHFRLTGHVHV